MTLRGPVDISACGRWAAMVLLLAATVWGAERCSVCKRALGRRFLTSGSRRFCSQACFRKTVPRCAACGKRVGREFLTSEGRAFCSDRCYETTLSRCAICERPLRKVFKVGERLYCAAHAQAPRCHHCGLPFAEGVRLSDGRRMCGTCNDTLIYEPEDARLLLLLAAEEVERVTGYRTPTLPPLRLVGAKEVAGFSRPGNVERGRYYRDTNTVEERTIMGRVLKRDVTVEERIDILYGLSREQFLSTACHELTHDLLHEVYSEVAADAPLWLREGVCQYVSAAVCRRRGFDDLAAEIAAHDDPVYGDGYRYVASRFGPRDWARVAAWLASGEPRRLPDRPPND